ncbi:hypothetical protein ONZ45_g9050 [Pleurotus djamor]|nr:hypothetical protein ONZ45_g9050 [Pleurotus djamor]
MFKYIVLAILFASSSISHLVFATPLSPTLSNRSSALGLLTTTVTTTPTTANVTAHENPKSTPEEDMEAELKHLFFNVEKFGDAIEQFPTENPLPGELNQLQGAFNRVHRDANTVTEKIKWIVSFAFKAVQSLSEAKGRPILTRFQNLEPSARSVMDTLIRKKPAFETIPVAETVFVRLDIGRLRGDARKVHGALASVFPVKLLAETLASRDEIDVILTAAAKAYEGL